MAAFRDGDSGAFEEFQPQVFRCCYLRARGSVREVSGAQTHAATAATVRAPPPVQRGAVDTIGERPASRRRVANPGNGEGAMTWDTGSEDRPSGHSFALGDDELDDWGPVPTQHRLRTLQCPSLPRLVSTSAWRLSSGEQAHVGACPYCQKVLAMAWRYECPCVGL